MRPIKRRNVKNNFVHAIQRLASLVNGKNLKWQSNAMHMNIKGSSIIYCNRPLRRLSEMIAGLDRVHYYS